MRGRPACRTGRIKALRPHTPRLCSSMSSTTLCMRSGRRKHHVERRSTFVHGDFTAPSAFLFVCSHSRVFTPPRPVGGAEELNFARVSGGRPDLDEGWGVGTGPAVSILRHFPVGTHFGQLDPMSRAWVPLTRSPRPLTGGREPAAQLGVHTDTD
eukprot:scaffold8214_cov121-Isochrysis_galbana.AAC.12